VKYEQFIRKLEKAGIEYTVFRSDTARYVEVGRFAYCFDERGRSQGGWVRSCAEDWRTEWQKWAALLTKTI